MRTQGHTRQNFASPAKENQNQNFPAQSPYNNDLSIGLGYSLC